MPGVELTGSLSVEVDTTTAAPTLKVTANTPKLVIAGQELGADSLTVEKKPDYVSVSVTNLTLKLGDPNDPVLKIDDTAALYGRAADQPHRRRRGVQLDARADHQAAAGHRLRGHRRAHVPAQHVGAALGPAGRRAGRACRPARSSSSSSTARRSASAATARAAPASRPSFTGNFRFDQSARTALVPGTLTAVTGVSSIATGDVDHDADVDAVLGATGATQLLRNDGNGNFAASSLSAIGRVEGGAGRRRQRHVARPRRRHHHRRRRLPEPADSRERHVAGLRDHRPARCPDRHHGARRGRRDRRRLRRRRRRHGDRRQRRGQPRHDDRRADHLAGPRHGELDHHRPHVGDRARGRRRQRRREDRPPRRGQRAGALHQPRRHRLVDRHAARHRGRRLGRRAGRRQRRPAARRDRRLRERRRVGVPLQRHGLRRRRRADPRGLERHRGGRGRRERRRHRRRDRRDPGQRPRLGRQGRQHADLQGRRRRRQPGRRTGAAHGRRARLGQCRHRPGSRPARREPRRLGPRPRGPAAGLAHRLQRRDCLARPHGRDRRRRAQHHGRPGRVRHRLRRRRGLAVGQDHAPARAASTWTRPPASGSTRRPSCGTRR